MLLVPASLFRPFLWQVFGTWCAIVALMLFGGAARFYPNGKRDADPFVAQLTSSPSSAFATFGRDISANGFYRLESNGDIATDRVPSKNRMEH
jgi:hypothetical protein